MYEESKTKFSTDLGREHNSFPWASCWKHILPKKRPKAETIQISGRKKEGTETLDMTLNFQALKLQLRLLSNTTAQRQVGNLLGRLGVAVCIYQF